MHTGEPARGSPLPHNKRLTRSLGDAEDVREVLKISLRSLRSLRLKFSSADLQTPSRGRYPLTQYGIFPFEHLNLSISERKKQNRIL